MSFADPLDLTDLGPTDLDLADLDLADLELADLDWYAPVPPVPTRRPDRATYRRRRMAAIVVVAATTVVITGLLAWVSGLVGSALGGVPASAPERTGVTYRVAPGDTLWGIASRLDPGGDRRSLVAALVERNGGDALRVGQTLVIPVIADG